MISVIAVERGTELRAVNAALAAVEGEMFLLVDEHSVPSGDWRSAALSSTADLLGGVVRTYAGTRAGYLFERSLNAGKRLRRQAVPFPGSDLGSPFIEIPNEGCLLIRCALLRSIGFLNEALPLESAILEFALRAMERGYELRVDARLIIDRVAGTLEPTLNDEALYAALRTERQWEQLLRGPARRTELRRVDVIAHGSSDRRALTRWLEAAGYPVSESVLSTGGDPRATIERALGLRDRSHALIDLRVEPCRDWLLELVEASAGNRSVGITTCGESAHAYRVFAADAAATLIVSDRIPAQITLNETGDSFDALVSELSAKAASYGVVTRTAAVRIERKSDWRPRYLDAHTLESVLARPVQRPTVSLILLAASSTGAHRYTTDALRAYSGDLAELFLVLRSDAPKIATRLRNQANVQLFVDPDDELAGNALSRALAKARGDVIVVMRDDYLVTEHWLEDLLTHLERLPQAGIVAPLLSGVPGVQNCESEIFADSVEFRHAMERRRRAHAREARFVDFIQMPSFVMRRAVLQKIGDFDEKLAVSHYGMIDYCLRARTAGFGIALAEDVYLYHLPMEHSESPFEREMGEAAYAHRFATKWRLNADRLAAGRFEECIDSPLAQRYRFIAPKLDERPSIRPDRERVVFLLPLLHEGHWQQGAAKVRKYLTAFTLDDPVTLAIGREAGLKTSVIAARIRKMIGEKSLAEISVPDIVITEANDAGEWLASLPVGPRYLLLPDERLPEVGLLEEVSPVLLRRIIAEHLEAGLVSLPIGGASE
jgi:GT2 family glycosyltransferase